MPFELESEDAELATLVAGMAHELNNPITYVLGNLNELRTACSALGDALAGYRRELQALAGDAAPARIADVEAKLRDLGGMELCDELLEDACDGARRIRDLAGDLLSVSRSGHLTLASVRIDAVLEQTLRLVARPLAGHAELERDFAATNAVLGDPARLGQVFLNLLSNAIDACAAAGGRAHKVAVRTRDLARGVRVEIDDTGAGIDPSLRARVFAPFVTTKPAGIGTGLGLYLSRRIALAHRGEIGFEDRPGGGTRFWVELPSGPAPAPR
ncbi:MAG TPA: HAMP domain-containing sensor histidine kinase [Myxococcota bacterium]|nr:HAMP domain-containing sensor histidine kinase [Myxococcota bacterium]